jgi:Tol biopolymer transport system component
MIDERELLERELERFEPDPGILERVARRRERRQRRQRLAAGALGIAITVVVGVAAVTSLRDPDPAPDPGDPVTPTPSASPVPEPLFELEPGYQFVDVATGKATPFPRSLTSIRGAGNFDVSPDGSMILFDNASITADHTEPVEVGRHQLYVANIDGSGLRQLTNDPVGASQGSWSPYGTKVVYLGGWARLCCNRSPADLMVVDVATGTTTQLAHGSAKDFQEPFFKADGTEILVTRADPDTQDDLWTIAVDDGRQEFVLEDRGYAVPSPDGASMVYRRMIHWMEGISGGYSGGSIAEVWISDADGKHPRVLVDTTDAHLSATAGAGWSPNGAWLGYSQYLAWPDGPIGAYVLDTRTGDRTLVAFGRTVDWLDDRVLLVRASRGP